MEPKVMTAQEAAEVLNVSLSTIYNLRDRGTLPQIKKLPGVRFAAKDVLALVGEQTWEYTADEGSAARVGTQGCSYQDP